MAFPTPPGNFGVNAPQFPQMKTASVPQQQPQQVQVAPCPVCFALVVDTAKHQVWHNAVLVKSVMPWEKK
jgi:hypothetical protein